jgi:diacylglycerol kinase family enzyme
MRVTLIYNPTAGSEEQVSSQELANLVRAAGHVVAHQMSHNHSWHEALNDPADIVAVAGGDGTVGKVAKRLIAKTAPIAVLPLGTANNIATTLGLANQPLDRLIAQWTKSAPVRFDVGEAKGPWGSTWFIEGFGIGLFSDTMSALDARDNVDLAHLDAPEEKITSVLGLLKERLQSYPSKKLKVTLNGRDLSGDYILLEALNVTHIGPNLHLAPNADTGDGFLDVVLLSKGDADKLHRYLSECVEGKPARLGVEARRGRHLQMEWHGFAIHIDDEMWPDKKVTLPPWPSIIDVEVSGEAVQFLAPQKALT